MSFTYLCFKRNTEAALAYLGMVDSEEEEGWEDCHDQEIDVGIVHPARCCNDPSHHEGSCMKPRVGLVPNKGKPDIHILTHN